MALNIASLKSGLEGVFSSPGETAAECAQSWADALGVYAAVVVPPSTTVAAAKTVLASSLASAFLLPSSVSAMETAFLTFATSVGLGMAPTFIAVPPPAPVGFASQFAGAMPATHSAAATQIGDIIDTWMRTATAAPSVGGPAVPWT